jgi:HlyD family secretion protein
MNIIKKLLARKVILAMIGLVIIGGGYYWYVQAKSGHTPLQYMTEAAAKDTLTVVVSGTGQVASSNQVDVKPEGSGRVIKVPIKVGQEIKAGDLLAQLDAGDAQKAVRDAQISLTSARLSLAKTKQAADAASLLASQNSLASAKTNLAKLKLSQTTDYQKVQEAAQVAQDDLAKAYEDAYNAIANTWLNLPAIITKLDSILHSQEIGQSERTVGVGQWNNGVLVNTCYRDDQAKIQSFVDRAETDYRSARIAYDQNFSDYKNSSRTMDVDAIENLLTQTMATTKSIAQAAKSSSNMLDAWSDYRSGRNMSIFSKVTEYKTSLAAYIGQVNSSISSLLTEQSAVKSDKDAITNSGRDLQTMEQNNPLDLAAAEQAVKQQEASLLKLQTGTDKLDIQSQELAVSQRVNALNDARQTLADYTIKAPFDGVVAALNVKVGDTVAQGTAVATLVTKQKIAVISLNEVDVSKIALGDKVTLTFDAVADLDISGAVAEIDTIGTVSQGVVSYNVKINFDTQDERVKPGMSVSANIITEVKTDVLQVSNAAVQSDNNGSYVQILDNGQPHSVPVGVGLANDSFTEITNGLNVGDQVITQTIDPNQKTTTATTQRSGTSLLGGFGGGGGAIRGATSGR